MKWTNEQTSFRHINRIEKRLFPYTGKWLYVEMSSGAEELIETLANDN